MTRLGHDAATISQHSTDDLSQRIRLRILSALPYLVAVTISILVLNSVYKLSHTDLTIPLYDAGDATSYDVVVKNFVEGGGYNINPLLGAPGQQEMYDFPITHATHFLGFAVLRLFTRNYALVINLYYLLTYPLIAVTSLYTFRRLGVSPGLGVAGSVLFAFLPFHVLRSQYHLMHSSYYLIPLTVLTVVWVVHGHPLFRFDLETSERKGVRLVTRDGLLALISCGLIGTDNPYWAFFTMMFLFVGGMLGRFRYGHRRAFYSSWILGAVIVTTFGMDLLPNTIYASKHGLNPINHRAPAEAEVYGGRVTQLILPVTGHRIAALAKWKAAYNAGAPLLNENNTASLGLVGTVGFIFLFASFYSKPFSELFDSLSVLNLTGVLVFMIGGLGAVFSFVVWSQIRGYNRMSVYIGFFSILAFVLTVDRLLEKTFRGNGTYLRIVLVPLAILGVGLADQIPTHFVPDRGAVETAYRQDQKFVQAIESSLPPRSMIFELPYIAFPGQVPGNTNMSGYDELKGYLHSSSLRWSGGAMIGREDDLWIRHVSGEPADQMVSTLTAAGFAGIWIDRYGYADRGASIEDQILKVVGREPLVSENGRRSFFLLDPSRTKQTGTLAGSEKKLPICEGSFDLTKEDPLLGGALQGFSTAEDHGRWTDGTEASFTCYLPQVKDRIPATVRIITLGFVFSGHTQKVLISINQAKAIAENYIPGDEHKIIDLPLPSTPGGGLNIHFALPNAVSPQELGMNSDTRKIAVSIRSIDFR